MKTKFNLSEKRLFANMVSNSNAVNKHKVYTKEDVKEFIRLLKYKNVWVNGNDEEVLSIKITDLHKLAGEELI